MLYPTYPHGAETAPRIPGVLLLRVVRVRIEVPRGSFVKRHPDGSLDYASPLPCPFNYGSVLGTQALDGDPLDALVLGPRIERGVEIETEVHGVVWIRDAGLIDDKLVCSDAPIRPLERQRIDRFFTLYSVTKKVLNWARGKAGATQFEGWGDTERTDTTT